jgi:hypothetical protein
MCQEEVRVFCGECSGASFCKGAPHLKYKETKTMSLRWVGAVGEGDEAKEGRLERLYRAMACLRDSVSAKSMVEGCCYVGASADTRKATFGPCAFVMPLYTGEDALAYTLTLGFSAGARTLLRLHDPSVGVLPQVPAVTMRGFFECKFYQQLLYAMRAFEALAPSVVVEDINRSLAHFQEERRTDTDDKGVASRAGAAPKFVGEEPGFGAVPGTAWILDVRNVSEFLTRKAHVVFRKTVSFLQDLILSLCAAVVSNNAYLGGMRSAALAVETLFQSGVLKVDLPQVPMLCWALSVQCTDIVRALIAAGVDVNTPAVDGLTPVVIAVGTNNMEAVRALVHLGASLDVPFYSSGLAPLFFARTRDMVQLLAVNGADPGAVTCQGISVAMVAAAASFEDLSMWSALLEAFTVHALDVPTAADRVSNDWPSLMEAAIVVGNRALVRRILQAGFKRPVHKPTPADVDKWCASAAVKLMSRYTKTKPDMSGCVDMVFGV